MIDGVALTLAPDAADKPVAGDHVYALAPEAVRLVLSPSQIVASNPAFTFGSGFSVSVTGVRVELVQFVV